MFVEIKLLWTTTKKHYLLNGETKSCCVGLLVIKMIHALKVFLTQSGWDPHRMTGHNFWGPQLFKQRSVFGWNRNWFIRDATKSIVTESVHKASDYISVCTCVVCGGVWRHVFALFDGANPLYMVMWFFDTFEQGTHIKWCSSYACLKASKTCIF